MYLPTTAIFTRFFGLTTREHEFLPIRHVRRRGGDAEQAADGVVEALLLEHERHLVNGVIDVARLDHGVERHVAKHGELVAHVFAERMLGAADEHLRVQADLAQLGDGLLRRLGLQFARPP